MFRCTCGFRVRQLKTGRFPRWTARCRAVSPLLSCMFRTDENSFGIRRQAYSTTLYPSASTAEWRNVLPLASRKVAQSGHFCSMVLTTSRLSAKAATCMGYNPSASGWYAAHVLASSSSATADFGRGQTSGNHLERMPTYGHPSSDAARWRGVLPVWWSLCCARCDTRGTLIARSPCCTSTVTSFSHSKSTGSAACVHICSCSYRWPKGPRPDGPAHGTVFWPGPNTARPDGPLHRHVGPGRHGRAGLAWWAGS